MDYCSPAGVKDLEELLSASPGIHRPPEPQKDAEKNGRGVAAVRGKMVDKPVVLRARQTLALAEQEK